MTLNQKVTVGIFQTTCPISLAVTFLLHIWCCFVHVIVSFSESQLLY